MDHTLSLLIEDSSQVAAARRDVLQVLPASLYSQTEIGEIQIIITELGTNLLKHAKHGEILINPVAHDVSKGIEVISLDKGPGIGSIAQSVEDGFSTAGSPGNGLGAIKRLAAQFTIYSQPDKGTAVAARFVPERANRTIFESGLETSGINVPLRTEFVCGDDWECRHQLGKAVVLVVDGLGHGPDAHRAAAKAIKTFHGHSLQSPSELMEDLHLALRDTRGAAASAVWIDMERGVVRFLGIGNVSGAVADSMSQKKFATQNGTLGHIIRKTNEFSYPCGPDHLVILHSDGIGTQWNLADYPGLTSYPPTIIAAILYRDFSRGRDDATVVVSKRQHADRIH